MFNAKIIICVVGFFGYLQAMDTGKMVVVTRTWWGTTSKARGMTLDVARQAGVAVTSTPDRRLALGTTLGAGAVAGVYAFCRKFLATKMVDAESQTENATPQQIAGWLDDIVAKANEFQPQRRVVADLAEVRTQRRQAKDTKEIAAYDEAEKELVRQRDARSLLSLSSWQALQKCSLPVRSSSQLSMSVMRLNEALQCCQNDVDFRNKFGILIRFSEEDFHQTLEGCCKDFAAYVETIKKDILKK